MKIETERQFLTKKEKLMVNCLQTDVTFLPGSFDKKFCNGLLENAKYTEKQVAYLRKCFHKYRRQIKDFDTIYNLTDIDPGD